MSTDWFPWMKNAKEEAKKLRDLHINRAQEVYESRLARVAEYERTSEVKRISDLERANRIAEMRHKNSMNFTEIGLVLGISSQRARQIYRWAQRAEEIVVSDELGIDGLSTRARNALKNNRLYTKHDVAALSKRELLRIANFGRASLIEVEEWLRSEGIELID